MDRLEIIVQNYAWGDTQAIPALLGQVADGQPHAELWMGAHPKAPSVLASTGQQLGDAIAADPEGTLGEYTNETFGALPFLFKVLAAAKPLSIQTHPSLDQARAGFKRENDAGIALDSPVRTYRDANHKPEMICALTPFVGKCGFRNLEKTRDLFSRLDHSDLDELRNRLHFDGTPAETLAHTLGWLLRMDSDDAVELVRATVSAAFAATNRAGFEDELLWCDRMNTEFPDDIGVVVALLLNHVVLEPGEAFYLGAGNLHAYLEGVGVELMANSDNVVRGGMTPKNIDIEELLAVVDCTPITAPVQRPIGPVHTFDAPAPEFALTRVLLSSDRAIADSQGPEIVIVVEGEARLKSCATGQTMELGRGQVAFVAANDGPYTLDGEGTAFRASVPTK